MSRRKRIKLEHLAASMERYVGMCYVSGECPPETRAEIRRLLGLAP